MGEERPYGLNWDPWEEILHPLSPALSRALSKLGVSIAPEAVVPLLNTEGGEDWDVALPVHRFAKVVGRPAPEVAVSLAGEVGPVPGFARSQALGAYLNFTVEPTQLAQLTLERIFGLGNRYGFAPPSGAGVCVEHTSSNPTGPFHIGRVRNAVIGDTLARILKGSGSTVTTQYYVDDVGRQAAMITWIWSKPIAQWPPPIRATLPADPTSRPTDEKDDRWLGRPYAAVSSHLKANPDAAQEVQALSRQLEEGTSPSNHRKLAQSILTGMLASLARIGIEFDELVWESGFVTDGSVAKVVGRLEKAPHARREPNGALVIDAASYGLPKETATIVVTRGDGTTLYPTRDVAYHLSKFASFPRAIDVLGVDHLLHTKVLSALLAEIGEVRRPEFVVYQYLTLPGGGRMSTRSGTAVYLDDLLDEAVTRARTEILKRREDLTPQQVDEIAERVAAGAIRYHIVRTAPDKTVQFVWEDALSFEGRSGPFLQYAYARASSVLRKGEVEKGPYPFQPDRVRDLKELRLIKTLSRLPGTVRYAARTAHVHTVAGFAHQLAEEFNRFYQAVPVLKAEAEDRETRVALVSAARQALGNLLDLLGIARLDRM